MKQNYLMIQECGEACVVTPLAQGSFKCPALNSKWEVSVGKNVSQAKVGKVHPGELGEVGLRRNGMHSINSS